MRTRNFVAALECSKLLDLALQKKMLLTVTTKDNDNNWQVNKSTIISLHRHRMLISLPSSQLDENLPQMTPGLEIAVTFKKGYNKCLFTTRVIAQENVTLDDGTIETALSIYRPEQIEKIKRRAYERTEAPTSRKVKVTFWSENDTSKKYQAQLVNLSAGGVGLKMPTADLPQWPNDQQCVVQFVPLPNQEPVIAQARFRHATPMGTSNTAMLGFQFIGLELTKEGRGLLRRFNQIVIAYNRENQHGQRSEKKYRTSASR